MTKQLPRIDAHHHVWHYSPDDYGWIDDEMRVLQRDFLPRDLKPLLDAVGIEGAIAVQARQSLAETEWLLHLAKENPWIQGVVGWAPIVSPAFADVLAHLLHEKKLKGLRHVIQDEPDADFILDPSFNRGIRALRDTGLVYDILIHARHLPQTLRFVDLHPDQQFVLDHCAKPPVRSGRLEPWAAQIRALAERPNICCKLSGLVTEADPQRWTPASLEPWWRVVRDAFTPSRLIFGSDWPVLLLASDYGQWVETVKGWTGCLSTDEQAAIWGGTAARVYRL